MKSITAITCIAGILLQVFGKTMLFLDFKFNQVYIAANLCENRDVPALNCEGCCVLKKQLTEEEKREQHPGSGNVKERVEWIGFSALDQLHIIVSATSDRIDFYYRVKPITGYSGLIFHPPAGQV